MFAGAKSSPSPSSMLDLEFAELSDVGRVRDHNEDYFGHCACPLRSVEGRTHGWLFAVADGVGGEEHGEVASQTAIETLIAGFRARSERRSPHGADAAPGANGQHPHL